MKTIHSISFIIIITACSDSNFRAGVATGSPPASADAESNINADPTPIPPSPAPVASLPSIDQLTAECAAAGANLKVLEQSISYPERKGCSFGVAPNLGKRDLWIQASETSTQQLTLPSGTICDISIESPKNALLHYDDMLVLSIENYAIFVSTENLLPFLEQKDGVYLWDFNRVVGKKPRDFGGKSYCIGDAAGCIIPDTDKTGPVAISLPNSKIAPIAVAIAGKTAVSMNLTATGDNDNKDCSHTQLDVKVTFKYLP